MKATAQVAAIAKYEVRKNITEVVPPDVTRAKAGAWLTLISPITQWAGLKGDQLAHKRDLLRLQQEESLYEIAKRAREKIASSNFVPQAVPNKFLVPFLEKASLEEPGNELIELWSSLLASAATEYDPHYIHFANLISQMSARQARLFSETVGTDEASYLEDTLFDLQTEFLIDFIQNWVQDAHSRLSPNPTHIDEMWAMIQRDLHQVGLAVEHVELEDGTKEMSDDDEHRHGHIKESPYQDAFETDFAILDAIRLLKYVDTGYFVVADRWRVKVMCYYVTALGREFAKACGIVS
ncbi:hypothetical protein UNPF46_10965 [Bradyrhizobium sp. UNPF46]|nr:hypothetical protein UNPF46_10965 [Bradyrhizobium sp. UNPF46]